MLCEYDEGVGGIWAIGDFNTNAVEEGNVEGLLEKGV
jgi:hypothetical protein